MVEQTAHDERSAAVCAAIEIMRSSQAQLWPLGGSEPAAPFVKLTCEESRFAVPPWVTGRRIRLGQNEVGLSFTPMTSGVLIWPAR
jgi:hypothetical protein